MPKRVLAFSRPAAAEYREITKFSVQHFGLPVANAYMAGMDAAIDRLCEFPEMAPVDARYTPPTRCLTHRSHRIYYRERPDRILIVRILHHARTTPAAL